MAAWGDSEDSSSDDENKESANIFFMAWEDEVHSTLHLDFDIEELSDVFNELMNEYKKLNKKRKETNSLNEKLNDQLRNISREKDKLVLENELLRKENEKLDELIKDLVKKNKT